MNKPQPKPSPTKPSSHPLWPAFVRFVQSGRVVRRSLLKESDWHVFLAGACA